MATIRKRTASLVLANGGTDSEDVSVRGAGSRDRFAGVFGVRVTHTEVKGYFSVSVYEVDDIEGDDVETYGRQLFFIQDPEPGKVYYPRDESVTVEGAASGDYAVVPNISTEKIRVEANGGTDAGTLTVDVFVQTAGDQRF